MNNFPNISESHLHTLGYVQILEGGNEKGDIIYIIAKTTQKKLSETSLEIGPNKEESLEENKSI